MREGLLCDVFVVCVCVCCGVDDEVPHGDHPMHEQASTVDPLHCAAPMQASRMIPSSSRWVHATSLLALS